jgi:hypothetical protein
MYYEPQNVEQGTLNIEVGHFSILRFLVLLFDLPAIGFAFRRGGRVFGAFNYMQSSPKTFTISSACISAGRLEGHQLRVTVTAILRVNSNGGESGIRTHGSGVSGTHDFQSCPFGQLGHLSAFIALSHQLSAFSFYPTIFTIKFIKLISYLSSLLFFCRQP